MFRYRSLHFQYSRPYRIILIDDPMPPENHFPQFSVHKLLWQKIASMAIPEFKFASDIFLEILPFEGRGYAQIKLVYLILCSLIYKLANTHYFVPLPWTFFSKMPFCAKFFLLT